MTTRSHGLMRIFWPSDAPRDDIHGVLVGWRNSELDYLVVGVLQGVDVRNVEHALRMKFLFRGHPYPLDTILQPCGGQPLQVLGTLNVPQTSRPFDPKLLSLHVSRRNRLPHVYCPPDSEIIIQIITFDRPDPKRMQFLSLAPISLALGDKRPAFESVPPFDRIDSEKAAEVKRKQELVEKLKLHTVIRHTRTLKEEALSMIITQINCSAELNALMQQNIRLVGIRTKRSLSVSERVVVSATNLWDNILLQLKQALMLYVWPIASQLFIIWLMLIRICAEAALVLLDWRPFGHAALKDVSATAQQIDIRLQQFCYWPTQWVTLHRRQNDWHSTTNSHPEYIRFFNSLWLVANDIIIGIALGSYILENVDFVSARIDTMLSTYAITGLQRMLSWLMDYPAGLKLNTELAKFLGDLFLWVIEYWDGCIVYFLPMLPHLIRLIGLSSFAGASLPISMVSDLLSLFTIHIYSFYIASARIYNWQLTIITSLFHLFRGKKRNVLRNRIDSCDYDLDQLLLGTILFTLLFFLLPTVAVFYATFAGARITIIAMKAALDIWLACLNHFPLFALMLRIKDSRRLPGGIRFELQKRHASSLSSWLNYTSTTTVETTQDSTSGTAPIAYVKLKPVPLPLPQTFSQYAQLGTRLRKHYISPRVFLSLLTGQVVPPIHRKNLYSLQYSMLPAQRVGVNDLWLLLERERLASLTPTPGASGWPVTGSTAGILDVSSGAANGGYGSTVPHTAGTTGSNSPYPANTLAGSFGFASGTSGFNNAGITHSTQSNTHPGSNQISGNSSAALASVYNSSGTNKKSSQANNHHHAKDKGPAGYWWSK